MKLAYRESVAPGMVRLVIAIFCVLLALFTLLGPLDTRDSLAPIQRLAYFGMCGAMQVPICYAAAVLTLYLTRNLRPRQIALALTVTSLVVAVPCAAIAYTAYGLFRAGEPPGDRLSSIYLVCALDLWSATALGYYVLRLRLRRMIPRTSEDGTPPANESPDPVAGATTDARTRQSPTAANDIRQPPSTATAEIADEDDLPSRPAGPPAGRTSDHAKESPAVVPPERPPITDREPEAATGEVAPGLQATGRFQSPIAVLQALVRRGRPRHRLSQGFRSLCGGDHQGRFGRDSHAPCGRGRCTRWPGDAGSPLLLGLIRPYEPPGATRRAHAAAPHRRSRGSGEPSLPEGRARCPVERGRASADPGVAVHPPALTVAAFLRRLAGDTQQRVGDRLQPLSGNA